MKKLEWVPEHDALMSGSFVDVRTRETVGIGEWDSNGYYSVLIVEKDEMYFFKTPMVAFSYIARHFTSGDPHVDEDQERAEGVR